MIVAVLLAVLGIVLAAVAGLAGFTAWVAYSARRSVPPAGRMLEVEGVRLHYRDEGSGPALVMIHGLASQMQSFTYALSPLLRDRYRLLILDRPGNGYSAAAPSASLKGNAAVIADFLRALGIERALVIGHSLGGAVALALAVDHPKLVAGLALIAPATQAQEATPDALRGLALRSPLARFVVGWTIAAPLAILNQHATLRALFAPDPVAPDFGTRGGSLLPLRPWAFRNASRDLVEGGEELAAYAARHAGLAMPVGVLFGTGDGILDYRLHGGALAKSLPGVELELIHGGHMLPLTQPETCAAFIDRMAAKAGLPP